MSWREAWKDLPIGWQDEVRAVSPISRELFEVQFKLHQDLFRMGYEAGQKSKATSDELTDLHLLTKIKRLESEKASLQGENKKLDEIIDKLESEKAALEKLLDSRQTQINILEDEKSCLFAERNRDEQEIDKLKEQNRKLEKELGFLRQDKAVLENQLSELNKKLYLEVRAKDFYQSAYHDLSERKSYSDLPVVEVDRLLDVVSEGFGHYGICCADNEKITDALKKHKQIKLVLKKD